MTTLTIIIVSWNTRDLLRRCITTIHTSLADSGIGYRVVVVDNASADGTPAVLRAEHPEVALIEAGRNLGFAGGNNLALRKVLSSEFKVKSSSATLNSELSILNSQLDYVLLLNPDTEVVGDAIARLVRYLDTHPDVAVVGPRLCYPDGSVQPSRRRFPTAGVFFWESTPLEQLWPNNPWARRYCYTETPDDAEQEVEWLVGAALLVRPSAIQRAGLLDAGFQMYSEELEWQRRIRDLRLETRDLAKPLQSQASKIIYLPSAVIIHHEGKSSEQAPAQRYVNFQRSRIRDARMVYGAGFAGLLRWFLRAAYAAELATEAAKWLLGHKRPLRTRRISVYWQVIGGL
jgi:N-acetylglucosaminyl-diphospho-decaprenol L-rhamnosyltransferase